MNDSPRQLDWGEEAPWFHAAALNGRARYAFDSVGGRYVLLLFYGSTTIESSAAALKLIKEHRWAFDDEHACFFGITVDEQDVALGAIAQQLPGIRYFLDYDGKISRMYGALSGEGYRPYWLLLDPTLRVAGRFAIDDGVAAIKRLRSLAAHPFTEDSWAPVLLVPNVFEPSLCAELIRLFQSHGGEPSGFMQEVDGKTKLVTDPHHKQRTDCNVDDASLRAGIAARINTRLRPAVKRTFQFSATRMERYLVACYEAGAGHFRPHRDNTTKGTAHRRFAVTINLNAGEYGGGDLRFPEYGPRTYRAPTGGAIVFSCSMLHEATPVIQGKRYAFLPFLYDDEAAQMREENNPYLDESVGRYRRSQS